MFAIDYKDFYQGRIACGELENEVPYYSLHSTRMSTFSNNYAFILLDSYVTVFKSVHICFYVFDSHARNCFVIPDVKGSAVVMKYDITQLEL